jgi:hypothetical protein
MDRGTGARRGTRLLPLAAGPTCRGTSPRSNCASIHVLQRRLPDRAAVTAAAFDGRRATGMERYHVGLWLRQAGGLTRAYARVSRAPFSSGAQGGADRTACDCSVLQVAPADCATRSACRLGRVLDNRSDGLHRSHLNPGKAAGTISQTYKRLLNEQRREGSVACLHDQEKRYLSDFVSIYEETMRRVKVATWRWIVAPETYHKMCERRTRMDERQGLQPASADYFSAYRCPTVPRVCSVVLGAQNQS